MDDSCAVTGTHEGDPRSAIDHGRAPFDLSVEAFAALRRSGVAPAVLDVREPWETAICRLDDSVCVPLGQLPGRLDQIARVAGAGPVVVCHHGIRSAHAVAWLRRNGLSRAINLAGGIDAWARRIDPTMEVY